MKRPTFLEGVGVALVASIVAFLRARTVPSL